MIQRGMAAAFDLKPLLTMLGVLSALLAAVCTFGNASGGSAAAGKSLPGVGG